MAAEPTHAIDALGPFKLEPVIGSLHFSQSNVFMLVAALLTLGLLVLGMRPRAVVPGRFQALAEMAIAMPDTCSTRARAISSPAAPCSQVGVMRLAAEPARR